MAEIGIITEQGDLGFGFDKLNTKDETVYNEAVKRQENDNNTVINEEKK